MSKLKSSNPVTEVVEVDATGVNVDLNKLKDRLKSNTKIKAGAVGAANAYIVLSTMCNVNRIEHGTKTSAELVDIEIVKAKNWESKDNKFGNESYFDTKTGVLLDEYLQEFFNEYGDDIPSDAGVWFRRSIICPLVGKGKVKIYELNLDFSSGNILANVYLCNDGKTPYLDKDKQEKTPANNNWSFSQVKPLEIAFHQEAKMNEARSRIEYQLSLA
jgi:hypothetical protein